MIFRYVISGSLALVSMYLTCRDLRPGFSSTLTTKALYLSSLRWFEISSYQPSPRDLPSSFIQHGGRSSWHTTPLVWYFSRRRISYNPHQRGELKYGTGRAPVQG